MGQRSLQALESWSRASPTYHAGRTNSKTGKHFWELLRKGGRQWGRQRARKGMPVGGGAPHSTVCTGQAGLAPQAPPARHQERQAHPPAGDLPSSPGPPLSLGLQTEVLRGLCGLAGRSPWASQTLRRSVKLRGARKTTDRKGLYVSGAGLSLRKFSSFLKPT